MRTLTCDILVVGAGPAGSSAAREAASKGASVIVVERRAVVGVPVQCAEYISKVAGWIDCKNRNLMPAVQARVALDHPMDYTEIFLDDRIYGGYGWLFPKGNEANVGVGMKVRCKGGEIGRVLFDLLARLSSEGKISGRPLDIVSGWVPVEPAGTMRAGNILLAGDAAGHTHPITGAGIPQAIIGGGMAGKWAAHAVDRADSGKLAGYVSEWREFFGETLEKASSRRRLLESKWDRLEEIVKYCWVTFKEYHSEYE